MVWLRWGGGQHAPNVYRGVASFFASLPGGAGGGDGGCKISTYPGAVYTVTMNPVVSVVTWLEEPPRERWASCLREAGGRSIGVSR